MTAIAWWKGGNWHSVPVAIGCKTVTCRKQPPRVSRDCLHSDRRPWRIQKAQREPTPIRSQEFIGSGLPGSPILPRRPIAIVLGDHVEDEVQQLLTALLTRCLLPQFAVVNFGRRNLSEARCQQAYERGQLIPLYKSGIVAGVLGAPTGRFSSGGSCGTLSANTEIRRSTTGLLRSGRMHCESA